MIGQLCCPEEVKPRIMLITIFTIMIMMALNDDDHHNNLLNFSGIEEEKPRNVHQRHNNAPFPERS